MTYTVWSHGRLLGESPLDLISCTPKFRLGFLYPSALGETLLPVASGVSAASHELARATSDVAVEDWHRLPEHAAYLAAVRKSEAMKLELRGPDGTVIPTEYVCVRDCDVLIRIAGEAIDDSDAVGQPDGEFGEETLHAMGLDDWDAKWDPSADEDRRLSVVEDPFAPGEAWRNRAGAEPRGYSRYQLQVDLIDDASIP